MGNKLYVFLKLILFLFLFSVISSISEEEVSDNKVHIFCWERDKFCLIFGVSFFVLLFFLEELKFLLASFVSDSNVIISTTLALDFGFLLAKDFSKSTCCGLFFVSFSSPLIPCSGNSNSSFSYSTWSFWLSLIDWESVFGCIKFIGNVLLFFNNTV